MPQPAPYLDGNIVIGSQDVVIGGITFTLEEFELSGDSRELDTHDKIGKPKAQALVPEKRRGTTSLQVPDSSTPAPARFTRFTAVEAGGNVVNLVLKKVGQKFTHMGVASFSCEVLEVLNP